MFHLIPLPGSPPGFLTSSLLASALVFAPWTGIEKIAAINTRDCFHIRHHDGFIQIEPTMVKENGLELKELNDFSINFGE
jgi:hypothetical protein